MNVLRLKWIKSISTLYLISTLLGIVLIGTYLYQKETLLNAPSSFQSPKPRWINQEWMDSWTPVSTKHLTSDLFPIFEPLNFESSFPHHLLKKTKSNGLSSWIDLLSRSDLNFVSRGVFPKASLFCLYPQQFGPSLAHLWNISPLIRWTTPPQGTRSLLLLLYNPDEIDLKWRSTPQAKWINQPHLTPDSLIKIIRFPFFYWVLTHIDPHKVSALKWGDGGTHIHLKGKPAQRYPHGISGLNSHTLWWKTEAFQGSYGDYDGPCPAVNDPLKVHRVRGILLALTDPLQFTTPPTGIEVLDHLQQQSLSSILGYSAFEWTFNRSLALIPP